MFSKLPKGLLRRLDIRLTVQFSIIFVATSLALFFLGYVLLSSSLTRKDHEELQSKFREVWALYQIGGIGLINREIRWQESVGSWKPFFVRVADMNNRTIGYIGPELWREFEAAPLAPAGISEQPGIVRLRSEQIAYELEAVSILCSDGNLLQVGVSTQDRSVLLRRFRGIFWLILMPLLILSLTGGLLSTYRLLRPIHRLLGAVRSIVETGKMDARISADGSGDELDELTHLFNTMLERIESLIKAMKDALDNVAHDLRTPLTRVRGVAEIALRSSGTLHACREALADCMEETDHILTILNTLTDISEAETGVAKLDIQVVDLTKLAAEVVELYQYVAEEKNIILTAEPGPEIKVPIDANRIRQMLANIVDNAVKFTDPGGRVTVQVLHTDTNATVIVADSGIGISAEDIPSIWDRLYRGEKGRTRPGLGLGLSLVKAYVHAHGGEVRVASQIGTGSVFTVLLPLKTTIPTT